MNRNKGSPPTSMAEAAKHITINGGTLILELRSVSGIIRTRKTIAFAYGFIFTLVAFTVFLAFNPSPNASSPWFTNIFTNTTTSTNSHPNSSTSQFSSIISYFFPPSQQVPRSTNTTTSRKPIVDKETKTLKDAIFNQTLTTVNKNTNQTSSQTQSSGNSDKVQVLKETQNSKAPPSPEPNVKFDSSGKNRTVKDEKGVLSNHTYALPVMKEQNNGSIINTRVSSNDLFESLIKCNFFDGEWIKDDSYPLYKPGSCSLIDEQFNCILNGRPDKDYQKNKWKPKGCTLPRLDGGGMLELLRGKRLVFVGDSLNRNMWESLVCILRNSVKNQSKVYEANGRRHFRGEASYSFIFEDHNCTIEFFVSPFLVQEWETADKNGSKKETLRLDLVGKSSNQYKDADIIIFNTGHWWTHDKTSKGKDYYQEGSHVYGELNVLEAFRKALTTWARWVDANINPIKSAVFFRGYSASHFSGGQWNSGGQCDSETLPIKNETYLKEYPPKMRVLERVLRGMKTHVTYLNITRMTDFRKDGHPSIYRKQNLSLEERRSPLRYQDCSHWCLPGVPDAWNEVLYAELLVRQKRNLQQQKMP